ncbi:MAG: hypothetical protein ACUVQQ_14375 [Thermogutta sp.]
MRSISATSLADSFYHGQCKDRWWLQPDSWSSGWAYENATYDDYHYQ